MLEAGIAQHTHRQVAAFRYPAILRGDRRLAYPLLQALHGFIVTLLDLLVDRGTVRAALARPAASAAPVAMVVPRKVLRVTGVILGCPLVGLR